jgi:hypothetical protein
MPNDPRPVPPNADLEAVGSLFELQTRQFALIKKAKDVMRELDEVTAQIENHHALRTDAAARWKKG